MNNSFTYKFIVLELLEKIYRLKNYISKNNLHQYSNSNEDVIKVFNFTIQTILGHIEKLVGEVNTMSNIEEFVIQRKLANIFESIECLHGNLKYLHTDWLRPEIYTFVNRIIKTLPELQRSSMVNIILSDEYTFLETNLAKKFDDCVANLSPLNKPTFDQERPTVILPKIEYSNPLNWPILTHELAHIDDENIASFLENEDLYPKGIPPADRKILSSWAEEIYCDLYAANILGPCYFFSISTFAILNSLSLGMGSSSKTHPPFAMRMAILFHHLDINSLNIPIDSEKYPVDNMHTFFYSMLHIVEETLLNVSGFTPNERLISGLNVFDDYLKRNYNSISNSKNCIKTEMLSTINVLVDKLIQHIPIGSMGNCATDKDLLIATLETELSFEQFVEIRDSLTERPTEIAEILNAGWLHKFNNIIPLGMEIFFGSTEGSFSEKLSRYGDHLDILDDRLLISIETSSLLEFIEH